MHSRVFWIFTITHQNEPLPELQPFYSVVLWPHFEAAKHVRTTIAKIKKLGYAYRIVNEETEEGRERVWRGVDIYHRAKHGSNWLSKRYFSMLCAADADPSVNFHVHCIQLYRDGAAGDKHPLAGEIGFSIGRIYTSLSGYTRKRNAEGTGTNLLVLLGRWLQESNFACWSMGHCYSPAMDYKRRLGHRIYPRKDFLALIKRFRGSFLLSRGTSPGLEEANLHSPHRIFFFFSIWKEQKIRCP